MATKQPLTPFDSVAKSVDDYANCLIKPMGRRDDEPLIDGRHILDAVLVSAIVFFAVILGDVGMALTGSGFSYLTFQDIIQRMPTALSAFFLTFFAQWARARGLDIRDWLINVLE